MEVTPLTHRQRNKHQLRILYPENTVNYCGKRKSFPGSEAEGIHQQRTCSTEMLKGVHLEEGSVIDRTTGPRREIKELEIATQ